MAGGPITGGPGAGGTIRGDAPGRPEARIAPPAPMAPPSPAAPPARPPAPDAGPAGAAVPDGRGGRLAAALGRVGRGRVGRGHFGGRRGGSGAAGRDTTIVFLHIPKTAGQTIHAEFERTLGPRAISPVRVHTQAAPGAAQMPPGYRLYSGHIDWEALDTLPTPRFVFTVLRDPLERIASFYFYLRRQARGLDPGELKTPRRFSMRRALEESADAYFFEGRPGWQRFVLDHYHSTYCSYLITRRMRGYAEIAQLSTAERVARAVVAARALDGIYAVDGLAALERDLETRLGLRLDLTGRFVNADPAGPAAPRWPRLEAAFEREESVAKLRAFADADARLMHELGLGPRPDPPG